MPETRVFSLADSMQAATGAARNTMLMRQAQSQMADEQVFRNTARQAAAGAPQPMAPGMPGQNAPPAMIAAPGQANAPTGPLPPVNTGMNMGAATQSQSAQAIQQLFSVETAGHRKGYDPDYHAQLLEQQGYPEKAMALRSHKSKQAVEKIGMQTQILDYIAKAAPLVTDQQSLDALRGSLSSIGLDPAMIPQAFDEGTQKALQIVGMGAAKQADLMFKELTLGETMRHNRATEKSTAEKNWTEKKGTLKPNDVRMRVADLFGGVYDPMSGRIGGLDKDKTTKALSLMEAAERIYADGKGDVQPAEAVSRAARSIGIMVPKVNAGGAPRSGEQTAINPTTGERIVLRDGQWVPVK